MEWFWTCDATFFDLGELGSDANIVRYFWPDPFEKMPQKWLSKFLEPFFQVKGVTGDFSKIVPLWELCDH